MQRELSQLSPEVSSDVLCGRGMQGRPPFWGHSHSQSLWGLGTWQPPGQLMGPLSQVTTAARQKSNTTTYAVLMTGVGLL